MRFEADANTKTCIQHKSTCEKFNLKSPVKGFICRGLDGGIEKKNMNQRYILVLKF